MTKTMTDLLEKMQEFRQGYLNETKEDPARTGMIESYDEGVLTGMADMIDLVKDEIR